MDGWDHVVTWGMEEAEAWDHVATAGKRGPRVGVGNLEIRSRFEVKVYFLNFESERVSGS